MNTWDEHWDVIIIGSGLAGLAAAIEAAKTGARVTVLEKMKLIGGNTRISGGALAAANNYLQRERGIMDSPDFFFEDMLRAGLHLNHPDLARIVAERSSDAIEWTRHELGVRYLDRLDRFGGHSIPRSLTTPSHSGVDIIKAQAAKLDQLGVKIKTQCLLTNLIIDPETKKVRGLSLREGYSYPDINSGHPKCVAARQAVILATGGYGYDFPFCRFQRPTLDDSIQSSNHRGATAEALIAALNIGALPVHLSWLQMGPWGCPDEKSYGKGGQFASYCIYQAGILIDPGTGSRIVNEWGDRKERSEAILRIGHPCIGLVDRSGAELDLECLRDCLKRGKVKSFDTLSSLSHAYGIPLPALEKTIHVYNRAISEGRKDEFGKPLDKGIQPIETLPFYTMRIWPKLHFTPGGIGINTKAQVIDLHGQPFGRFFAAGEVTGGGHGASRLACCALTECLVFGRIAGKEAVA